MLGKTQPMVKIGLRSCVWCRGEYYEAGGWRHEGCVVANRVDLRAKSAVVANAPVEKSDRKLVANGTRHGKYRDVEARREYMRAYMARRRKEARNGDHGSGVADCFGSWGE